MIYYQWYRQLFKMMENYVDIAQTDLYEKIDETTR